MLLEALRGIPTSSLTAHRPRHGGGRGQAGAVCAALSAACNPED